MNTLAIIAALEHDLSLLSRAIRQPADAGTIQPGDLLQLAPDAPDYPGYFLYCSNVGYGRARGSVLTAHRSIWRNVPLHQVSRIGAAPWPQPRLGFVADPAAAALELEARDEAHRADVARKTAIRQETIRRTSRLKAG